MAKVFQRAGAMLFAIVFLVSSVALTFFAILQSRQINNENSQTNPAEGITNQENAMQLKGTKLEGFTPIATVDQLQTVDLKEGTGEEVKAGATVTGHYTGALAKDGTIFESSLDSGEPVTFPLSNVIQGWQQGVPGMKVGGTRRLIIPASLAYGERGSPPAIGPNEPLIFDITLTAAQ